MMNCLSMTNLSTDTYYETLASVGEHSWLLEYIGKCKSGESLIGRELMQMLDMLLSHFDNSDIRFETQDAHKRIKFIQTQCRHSESPNAGKLFILELFQKAFIESIYSFKIFDTELNMWVRLYQDILFMVGKKNGKTPLVSAICLAEFFCGGLGTKILCSSNDFEQADLAFQAIDAMREQSPALANVTHKNLRGIYWGDLKKTRKKGKFSSQNKGSIRKMSAKKGNKEGRNIAVGMVDETHEMLDGTPVAPIRQGLSTQNEPLYFELTTEGTVADGYLDGRLREAREVLAGEKERPRWLIWLYTQDSEAEIWQDERTWVKSNPGMGVIKKWSYLRQMVEEAKTNSETRATVLCKDFDLKQSTGSAWLMESEIINEETYDLEQFRGCTGLGGVDLSETTDLTCAKLLIMRTGDNKKYVLTKYFIPQSKLDKPSDPEAHYQQWVDDKLIDVSPGNENDFSYITKWFYDLYKKYNIKPYKVGYDNALAKYWVKEMESYGFDMERVDQTKYAMSSPMRLVGEDLKSKLLVYNNNPVDRYCFRNTAFKLDESGKYILPVKIRGNTDRRIDGCVATIIAYAIYTRYRAEYLLAVR
jgi:phage terminase large subunit-like protein